MNRPTTIRTPAERRSGRSDWARLDALDDAAIAAAIADDPDTFDMPEPTPRTAGQPMTVQVYRDKAGAHRWRLVGRNGNILAVSPESYPSRAAMAAAVEALRAELPAARIVDA